MFTISSKIRRTSSLPSIRFPSPVSSSGLSRRVSRGLDGHLVGHRGTPGVLTTFELGRSQAGHALAGAPGELLLLAPAEDPHAEAHDGVAGRRRREKRQVWNSTSPVSSHFHTS